MNGSVVASAEGKAILRIINCDCHCFWFQIPIKTREQKSIVEKLEKVRAKMQPEAIEQAAQKWAEQWKKTLEQEEKKLAAQLQDSLNKT